MARLSTSLSQCIPTRLSKLLVTSQASLSSVIARLPASSGRQQTAEDQKGVALISEFCGCSSVLTGGWNAGFMIAHLSSLVQPCLPLFVTALRTVDRCLQDQSLEHRCCSELSRERSTAVSHGMVTAAQSRTLHSGPYSPGPGDQQLGLWSCRPVDLDPQ